MAKRQIEFDDRIPKFVVWAVGICFTVYFAANALYIENHEMKMAEEDFITQLKLSESTRYAEVAKYYNDEAKSRSLTEAEEARLDLVEEAQCRIRQQLKGEPTEVCKED